MAITIARTIPAAAAAAERTRRNAAPMIAVRGLKKRIGPQEILRGVDLSVAAGETLVIIGRSGGGKSVLLKNLIGLMQPNEGEIRIDGQSIIGLNERQLEAIRRKVGILFQGGALFDSMLAAWAERPRGVEPAHRTRRGGGTSLQAPRRIHPVETRGLGAVR